MIVGVPTDDFIVATYAPIREGLVVLANYEHKPLSGSDKTTERRTYYWSPPSTEEVKGHSKG